MSQRNIDLSTAEGQHFTITLVQVLLILEETKLNFMSISFLITVTSHYNVRSEWYWVLRCYQIPYLRRSFSPVFSSKNTNSDGLSLRHSLSYSVVKGYSKWFIMGQASFADDARNDGWIGDSRQHCPCWGTRNMRSMKYQNIGAFRYQCSPNLPRSFKYE